MLASRRAVCQAPGRLQLCQLRQSGPVARQYATAAAAASEPASTSTGIHPTPAPGAKETPSKSAAKVVFSRPVSRLSPEKGSAKTATKPAAKTAAKTTTAAKATTPAPLEFQYPPPNMPKKLSSAKYGATRPPLQSVDWSTEFYGIGAQPVSQEQFEALMTPLSRDDIEVKPDGIIYLPEIKYRRRLNEAFGPMGWGLIPKGEAVVGTSIVTREYALIADGRFVSQAQGENNFFGNDQLPSAVEGCKSNALMRCCKDLGIGSELWDPNFIRWFRKTHTEEVWVEHVTTKKKRIHYFKKGAVDVVYPYQRSK